MARREMGVGRRNGEKLLFLRLEPLEFLAEFPQFVAKSGQFVFVVFPIDLWVLSLPPRFVRQIVACSTTLRARGRSPLLRYALTCDGYADYTL